MTCTFYQNLTDTDATNDVLRQLAFNEPKMEFDESLEKEEESFGRNLKKRGKTTKQQQWFSKAAKKMSEGEGEGSCAPKYHGRSVRGIDCDMCWKWWVPYPCNCNCRGWEQVTVDCWKPCSHYNDEYTQTVGYYCWKPCDREGQLMFNVGCGLTPLDRTCASSTGDCIMKYVNHAISILDVLTSILSGGVAGAFKAAAKTAAKAGTKALAKAGLRAALKAAGKEFAQKLLKSNAIKRKMQKYATKTRKELKNQVVEQGSELFLAASMNTEPDWGGMIDEIAEALDPTGIYSLVKGFIPPDSCDDSVYMDEDIPDEEDGLPELDPLDTIDDNDPTNVAGTFFIRSHHGTHIRIYNYNKVDVTTNKLSWEKITIKPVGNNQYALKSAAHGERYLKVNGSGASKTVDTQTFVGSWERFYVEKKSNGKYAFKSVPWGNWLRAHPGNPGKLDTQTGAWSWEQFNLIRA